MTTHNVTLVAGDGIARVYGLAGAMAGARTSTLAYEAIPEWITGMDPAACSAE